MMIPKSLLSLLMVVAATFSVAATDLFYMNDFTIHPGGTAQVEIQLENETQYTAFQADVFLPDGLSVVDQSLSLTERKADHVLSSIVLVNGALRIMSYSMTVRPYSGNSGALVTFSVKADEDLRGELNVMLKNIRLTTMSGVDIALDDANSKCIVVDPVVIGDVNGDSNVTITDVTTLIHYLLNGNTSSMQEQNADVNGDGIISISDVTSLIKGLLNGDMGQ